jgi:phosphopantetheinyl transferase (holo-ACP synthase)
MPEDYERRRSTDLALDNLRRETDYRFEAISQRFVAIENATAAAMHAAKEAVIKAELAQEKRFDQVAEKIDTLTGYMDKLAGKTAGSAQTFGYMIAAATLTLSLVVFVVNYGFSK